MIKKMQKIMVTLSLVLPFALQAKPIFSPNTRVAEIAYPDPPITPPPKPPWGGGIIRRAEVERPGGEVKGEKRPWGGIIRRARLAPATLVQTRDFVGVVEEELGDGRVRVTSVGNPSGKEVTAIYRIDQIQLAN